jgi:hypothetical protein
MNRCIGLSSITLLLAMALVLGHAPDVSAQQFDRTPGPLIEDPPGTYRGETHIGLSATLSTSAVPLSTFVVTYNGFTSEAQAAFQAAVNVWASQIQSSVPIRITANWTTLGPNVLGSVRSPWIFRNFTGAPQQNTWYPQALANKLAGSDLDTSTDDIEANFNSDFNWYFGTEGYAPTKFDLMSVALHELGHGLGFAGTMSVSGDTGSWGISGGYPLPYDRFAINGSSQALLNTFVFPNPSSALGGQLVGGNVFFSAGNALNANGSPPKLYAPSTWATGTSYSHLDEQTYRNGNANSLMTPFIGPGEAIHDLGPILRAILKDIGWTVVAPASKRGDFDADGRSDITVYRPTTGVWYIRRLNGPDNAYQWGIGTDVPALGDFDSDGKSDVTVYRPETGVWWILQSVTNFSTYVTREWGQPGDIPVTGDYDGDKKSDVSVYRPLTGDWYALLTSTNNSGYTYRRWGEPGDLPVPADYDADGKTDIAVYRPSTGVWWIVLSSTNNSVYFSRQWGEQGDIPLPSDYDGDGKADTAVFTPSTGLWRVLMSSTNNSMYFTRQWGQPGDVPLVMDYDGDNKTDIVVYRPSTGVWWLLMSTTNFTAYTFVQWGVTGDMPVFKP